MKDRGLNEENQGFYITRNERQIAAAQTLGLFTRNASLNYFRGEISFPPSLDRYFGIQTNKNRFTLKEELKEQVAQALGSVISQINNLTRSTIDRIQRENEIREAEQKGPTPAEVIAAEGSKLLKVRPASLGEEAQKEIRRLETEEEEQIKEVQADPKLTERQKAAKVTSIKVRFETAKLPFRVLFDVLGDGNFYNPQFRARQAQVVINKEHPFFPIYERATQVPEQRILLDLLLQSAVHAEGVFEGNRDMTAAINQFRREWSIALKVFLEKKEEISEEKTEKLD